MGASASLVDVPREVLRDSVASISPEYTQYADIFFSNGIDGNLLSAVMEDNELDQLLNDLNITNPVHVRMLTLRLRKFKTAGFNMMNIQKANLPVSQEPIITSHPLSVAVPMLDNKKATHVFLTHDWGIDSHGRKNHDRVSRVNSFLKLRCVATWFDEDRLEGDIRSKMAEGVENTSSMVVFITSHKVNGPDMKDNCKVNIVMH